MILVCSPDLAKRCALKEVVVANADFTKALGTVEATSATDSVESTATASTTDALLPALESLEIDEPTTRRPVIVEDKGRDEQENEFETNGYLELLGRGSASAEGSEQNFTACSGSDCGWCGRCDY